MTEYLIPALYWLLELRKSRQTQVLSRSLDDLIASASWMPSILVAQLVILIVMAMLMFLLLRKQTK